MGTARADIIVDEIVAVVYRVQTRASGVVISIDVGSAATVIDVGSVGSAGTCARRSRC